MAKYSPQTNYFEISQKVSKFYNVVYWTIFVLSSIATVFKLNMIIDYLGVIAIVFLVVIEGISQDFKLRAEKVRRKDFFDNSFGTKFVHDSSDEYYDNDEIDYGIQKMFANLFENSFFSFNVSKVMFRKCLPKNLIFLIVIIILSMYGFSRNQFAIPILQLFLSKYFLFNILNTYKFRNETENIFDELKGLSSDFGKNSKLISSEIRFIKILIDYEVLIAETNIRLDSKVFNQMNQQLTSEWDALKKKYLMEENI